MDERDVDPVIEVYKRDVDRTLIRENLKLTVEERLRKGIAAARFAEEVRRAGRAMRSQRQRAQTPAAEQ